MLAVMIMIHVRTAAVSASVLIDIPALSWFG
jgi:hypothetical protein